MICLSSSVYPWQYIFRVDDVYGIGVGDMILKHSDFISTDVSVTKRLLNFTYTTDLSNPDSQRFQQYEEAFCNAVSTVILSDKRTCYINFLHIRTAVLISLYSKATCIIQERICKCNVKSALFVPIQMFCHLKIIL